MHLVEDLGLGLQGYALLALIVLEVVQGGILQSNSFASCGWTRMNPNALRRRARFAMVLRYGLGSDAARR